MAAESWITVEPQMMDRLYGALKGRLDEIRKAGSKVVGKAGKALRDKVVREVARYTGVRQRDVRKRYVWQRRKGLDEMTRKVVITGRGAALIHLRAREKRPKGVRYRPYGSASGVLPHAFIAKGRWRTSVFLRRGKSRLPIQAQYGPSIARGIRPLMPSILNEAAKLLHREMNRELARINRR